MLFGVPPSSTPAHLPEFLSSCLLLLPRHEDLCVSPEPRILLGACALTAEIKTDTCRRGEGGPDRGAAAGAAERLTEEAERRK